ncbi:MAG: hypothetical protein L3J82_00250 [Planctomycetes bacterium]|nr:hypothetical protein [Planctomycetota bacterium]
MNTNKPKPSAGWYALAPLFIFLGFVASGVVIFSDVKSSMDTVGGAGVSDGGVLQSYKANEWSTFDVELVKPGSYTIDYEVSDYQGNRPLVIPSAFQARVFHGDTEIETTVSSSHSSGNIGNKMWRKWRTFKIDTPGKYRIEAGFTENTDPSGQVSVDIGGDVSGGLLGAFVKVLAIGGISLLLGIVSFFSVRSKRKKSLAGAFPVQQPVHMPPNPPQNY